LAAAALAASVAVPALAADAGQVVLELVPAERAAEVVKVQALDRSLPQKLVAKEVHIRAVDGKPVDGAPGKWSIANLAPGAYDLYVETKTGKFEGYTLATPGAKPAEALTAEDREKIAELFRGVKTYEDEKRIIDLAGGGDRAFALVELIRRGDTSLKPGIVTWRVERWSYEKVYGTWQRENGGHKVLRRYLVETAREFAGWNWNFAAELGGVELKAGEKREVKWTIPDRFDPARGRAAGAPDAPRGPPAEKASGN